MSYNTNLNYVLLEAARSVAALLDEGKQVLLHCVAAHSRTPTVVIAYAMLRRVQEERCPPGRLPRGCGGVPEQRLPGCPETPRAEGDHRLNDEVKIPTFESRVRGLMLGLALGDAIGSKSSDVPRTGILKAGIATQLAGWTAEGLLRTATRYGGLVVGNPYSVLTYAYQRWALLRGGKPTTVDWNPIYEMAGMNTRGWLLDVSAMSQQRGSSPSTMKAILSGQAVESEGCQGMLRGLPVAALIGPRIHDGRTACPNLEYLDHYARGVSTMTHAVGGNYSTGGFSVSLLAECLRSQDGLEGAFHGVAGRWLDGEIHDHIMSAHATARSTPCVPEVLARLAPHKTGISALAGGLYVALCFPEREVVAEALEFAGGAPDGDSVAAVAGALLGAAHGVEALPVPLISRLELGWVMDTLARDLALQVTTNQAGDGWKGDGYEDPADPYWDTRYPGV